MSIKKSSFAEFVVEAYQKLARAKCEFQLLYYNFGEVYAKRPVKYMDLNQLRFYWTSRDHSLEKLKVAYC